MLVPRILIKFHVVVTSNAIYWDVEESCNIDGARAVSLDLYFLVAQL
jgi:hypothetical protein